MQKCEKILIRLLYLIYILLVLFFCFYKFSSSSLDLGKSFWGIRLDRYAHLIMFFPYPFISWLTCRYAVNNPFLRRYALALTLVSGLAFAALTEISQDIFFNSRQGDILDFAADAAAIVTASLIVHFAGKHIVRLFMYLCPASKK